MKSTDWDLQYKNDRDYAWLSTSKLTHVLNQIGAPKSSRALDIGCGTGQLCRDLAHRGFIVKGLDYSDTAIYQARQSTILPADTIHFDVCDIEKDEIHAEDKFDVIFCKYVFAFIASKEIFLQKIASLKTNTGVFVVISPDLTSLPDAKRHISMDHQDIIATLSVHFDNVVSEHVDKDYIYYAR